MWDLIYVNILCITFDTLTIVLIHLNRTGLHHSVQNFNYMLKFRLEFIVLNQLMAVAARGIRRETMAEQRYHYKGLDDSTYSAQKAIHTALGKGDHLETESRDTIYSAFYASSRFIKRKPVRP